MADNGCQSVLLDDLPSSTDEFGGHQKTADAIKEMLLTSTGGKAIALEGTWGSGKSTIVKLLGETWPRHVFVFDAWAHRGDLLRRAFLERLVLFLLKHDHLADEQRWRDELDLLAKRKSRTRKRSYPQLTWWGAVFAVFSLLLPIGTGFFSAGMRSSAHNATDVLMLGVGILLLLAPLLTAIAGGVHYWRKAKKSSDGKFEKGVLGLFMGKTATEEDIDSYETPEPSTIDFEDLFCRALAEAFGNSDCCFVVTVDNLDRLPQEDAIATWATLQVFLERIRTGEVWARHLWLLVPYDRPAIERLWDSRHYPQDASPEPSFDTHASNGAPDESRPSSFLDKTFQVRFDVPPLILANWPQYLTAALTKAMPSHPVADFDVVVSVFRRHLGPDVPTPRDIKLFVNDLAAMHSQYCGEYPLADLAYYVHLRRTHVRIVRAVQDGTLPEPQFRPYLSTDIGEKLLALQLKTDVTNAQTVLIKTPIEHALRTGKPEELDRYSSAPNFDHILEDVLDECVGAWAKEPASISNAAKAIVGSQWYDTESPSSKHSYVSRFARGAITATQWSGSDLESNDGLDDLIQIADDETTTKAAIKLLLGLKLEAKDEAKTAAPDLIDAWAEQVVRLCIRANSIDHSNVVANGVVVVGAVDRFVSVCCHLFNQREKTEMLWRHFASDAKPPQVLAAIQPTPGQPDWPQQNQNVIEVLLKSKVDYPWDGFADKCREFLGKAGTEYNPDAAIRILKTLWTLYELTGNETAIKTAATNGAVHNLLSQAASKSHADLAAWSLLTLIPFATPADAPPAHDAAATGQQLFDTFAKDPQTHPEILKSFVTLLPGPRAAKLPVRLLGQQAKWSKPLVRECLNHCFEASGKLCAFISPGVLLSRYNQLVKVLDEPTAGGHSRRDVLDALVADCSVVPGVIGAGYKAELIPLYMDLWSSKASEIEDFVSFLGDGLVAMNADEWYDDLVNAGHSTSLLDLMVRSRDDYVLDSWEYKNAHEKYGKALLGTDDTPAKLDDTVFGRLLDAMLPDARKVLCKNLWDSVPNAPAIPSAFITYYGGILAREESTVDLLGIARRVIVPALRRADPTEVEWVLAVWRENPNLVIAAPKEDQAELKEVAHGFLANEAHTEQQRATLHDLLSSAELLDAADSNEAETDMDEEDIAGQES